MSRQRRVTASVLLPPFYPNIGYPIRKLFATMSQHKPRVSGETQAKRYSSVIESSLDRYLACVVITDVDVDVDVVTKISF